MMQIDWGKVDPGARHRDAVNETISPLLDAIAIEEGCDPLELSWTVVMASRFGENTPKSMQLVTEILVEGADKPHFRVYTLGKGTVALVWDSTDSMKRFCLEHMPLPDGYRMAFISNNAEENLELFNRIKAAGVSTQQLMELDEEGRKWDVRDLISETEGDDQSPEEEEPNGT